MTTMHRTLRQRSEWSRLKQAQRTAEHDPGLRDLRHLLREHQTEETAAMRALGWGFVFIAGVALGVCLAAWWVGLL